MPQFVLTIPGTGQEVLVIAEPDQGRLIARVRGDTQTSEEELRARDRVVDFMQATAELAENRRQGGAFLAGRSPFLCRFWAALCHWLDTC